MYGLCMVAAVFLVALLTIRDTSKIGIPFEDVLIVGALAVGVGIICGGGLYILVTYSWQQIVSMIQQGDFRFLNSGIVFYGGLLGGIGGALVGCRLGKRKLAQLVPWIIPYIPWGHAIGRIGCVMAGCCYGVAYDGPLALHYPSAVSRLSPEQGYFPTQLLEAVLNLGLGMLLLYARKKGRQAFDLLFLYLGGYGIIRFCLEFLRGDSVRGVYGWFSTSQWISILLIAVAAVYGFCEFKRRHD